MATISVLVEDPFSEATVKSFHLKLDKIGETVVGVDVGWSNFCNEEATPSSVAFCGGNHCLFVPLSDNYWHQSLLTFLRDPKLTFVGMGIKEDLSALVKLYGVRFRNAVELETLAAKCLDDSRLDGCGLNMLERRIDLTELKKTTFACERPDDARCVGGVDVVLTTAANCYSYYKIGKQLLDNVFVVRRVCNLVPFCDHLL